MGDAVAGTLERLTQGRLRFAYDDAYRRRSGATPISLSMPLAEPTHDDPAVEPWVRGLLPDNSDVSSTLRVAGQFWAEIESR
jgi:serine/threonine-protein kinase HipA